MRPEKQKPRKGFLQKLATSNADQVNRTRKLYGYNDIKS